MTSQASPFVCIVSGLPRSGTSLMMQMVNSGGIPALTDHARVADTDNPRGYFEFEPVKQTKLDKTWLKRAPGHVVKMVHLLLLDLPLDQQYRVIMMRRDLKEVVKSQSTMLQRSGKTGATLPAEQLSKIFEQQMSLVGRWLHDHPDQFRVLEIQYRDLVADPSSHATKIAEFLERNMDIPAMVKAVDPSLYRNRST